MKCFLSPIGSNHLSAVSSVCSLFSLQSLQSAVSWSAISSVSSLFCFQSLLSAISPVSSLFCFQSLLLLFAMSPSGSTATVSIQIFYVLFFFPCPGMGFRYWFSISIVSPHLPFRALCRIKLLPVTPTVFGRQ